MLASQNVRQALLFLAGGGAKHLGISDQIYTPDILELFESDTTLRRLFKEAGVSDTYVGHDEDDSIDMVFSTNTLHAHTHPRANAHKLIVYSPR